jgi:hypothetical protein
MTSAEFIASNPLAHDDEDAEAGAPLGAARQAIMAINVHYDPYSPTAAEDYESLREELDQYPIMEIIRAELKKSRVDVTLSRKLISLCRHLQPPLLDDAIITLVENSDVLYPVYYNVLMTAKDAFPRLNSETQDKIIKYLRDLISEQSRVMVVDLNLQYAVRVIAMKYQEESRHLLTTIFRSDRNGAIKRDIILALCRWRDWHWLSDLKNRFRQLTDVERRAFTIASFGLGDEGEHWRKHMRRELSPMEELVRDWAQQRHALEGWQVPL